MKESGSIPRKEGMETMTEKVRDTSLMTIAAGIVGVFLGGYWTLEFLSTIGTWGLVVGIIGLMITPLVAIIEGNGRR